MVQTAANSTAEPLVFSCGDCGAELRVEAHMRTTACPYCDAPSVVERPQSGARVDPVFVVGFVLKQEQATEAARRWLSSRSLFARSGLAKAKLENIRGIYLPAYLYGATAQSEYQAEIGERYTVTETYRDSKGNTQTRVRTKTEWRTLRGRYTNYVKDRLVTASRGLSNLELESVEPFDLRAIHRYSPAMISGWIAEEASVSLDQCLQMAKGESLSWVENALGAFMPGDTHRALNHRTQLINEHIEPVLVPVWVLAARYDPEHPPMRVVVNGQTGATNGSVPYSWFKIGVAIAIAIIAIIAIAAYFSTRTG